MSYWYQLPIAVLLAAGGLSIGLGSFGLFVTVLAVVLAALTSGVTSSDSKNEVEGKQQATEESEASTLRSLLGQAKSAEKSQALPNFLFLIARMLGRAIYDFWLLFVGALMGVIASQNGDAVMSACRELLSVCEYEGSR